MKFEEWIYAAFRKVAKHPSGAYSCVAGENRYIIARALTPGKWTLRRHNVNTGDTFRIENLLPMEVKGAIEVWEGKKSVVRF